MLRKIAVALLVSITSSVLAAETVTYTYHAKGRLMKVVRTGSMKTGVQTEYQHDRADN